ncbi:MAG: tyrosine-type recombinase/integrase [Pirellulales bacterium]|nr:tyrosine-type recombinase/integrase [Pirellulales bacterium]
MRRIKGKKAGPNKRTVLMFLQAAEMFVNGTPLNEIWPKLGYESKHQFQNARRQYSTLWEEAVSRGMEKMVEKVRADAGTDAVLVDPGTHVAQAKRAEKWIEEKGGKLFPTDGKMTLSTFYFEHYLPDILFEATAGTKISYKVAVKKWAYLTGDPPVELITNSMLATFRDALPKISGRRGLKGSPNTVRSILQSIYTLLGKLGPAGPRNRDALGILQTIPWARPPRKDIKLPVIATEEQIAACYEAAACMDVPHIPGIKSPAWWKALLVLSWNTGLRYGSIFSARMEHLNWKDRQLILPSQCLKSRRPLIVHLNEAVMEHLVRIRTDREMLIPCPWRRDQFYFWFGRLQEIAGISESERFGLHNVRKSLATRLWEISPGAASAVLGHTAQAVTQQHYVNPTGIAARALDALPQPAVFVR